MRTSIRSSMARPPIPALATLALLVGTLGRLACRDQQIVLAPAELQIMLQLVQAAGDTVRRNKLEAAAWGLSEAVTPNALDVALHRLRRKLGVIGSAVEIVNMRGQGYALRQTGLG